MGRTPGEIAQILTMHPVLGRKMPTFQQNSQDEKSAESAQNPGQSKVCSISA